MSVGVFSPLRGYPWAPRPAGTSGDLRSWANQSDGYRCCEEDLEGDASIPGGPPAPAEHNVVEPAPPAEGVSRILSLHSYIGAASLSCSLHCSRGCMQSGPPKPYHTPTNRAHTRALPFLSVEKAVQLVTPLAFSRRRGVSPPPPSAPSDHGNHLLGHAPPAGYIGAP